jgi:3'(2'), 5'-bisphosphate nucleotidase
MSQTLLLSRLLAATVNVSRKAASIIREVKISGSLDVKEKSLNDYVTKADYQSQMCIIKSLEKMFPQLKFCGEEGVCSPLYIENCS